MAEVLGAETVHIGAVEQDGSGCPECRPAYYEVCNRLIRKGTKERKIRTATLLIAMQKSEIVHLRVELGAPLHVSWSCYSSGRATRVFESCALRLRAFVQAGVTDSIPYAG